MSKDQSTKSEAHEAPDSHPDSGRWWRWVCYQSWFALWALIIELCALFYFGMDEAAMFPVAVATAGLAIVATQYSGGSTVVEFAKAWRPKT